jgi:nucleotide-binding universal stress UspA family protein
MKTIVALVDFTEVTSKILSFAQTLGVGLGSRVILLHVVPLEPVVVALGAEAPAIPELPSREALEMEKEKLQSLLDSLKQRGVDATALQFEGRVVDTVIEETKRLNADLVIMGSHHHNAFYNLFIGSVAADILKNLPFPVLVVPADVPEKVPATRDAMSAEEVRQNSAVMQPVLSA